MSSLCRSRSARTCARLRWRDRNGPMRCRKCDTHVWQPCACCLSRGASGEVPSVRGALVPARVQKRGRRGRHGGAAVGVRHEQERRRGPSAWETPHVAVPDRSCHALLHSIDITVPNRDQVGRRRRRYFVLLPRLSKPLLLAPKAHHWLLLQLQAFPGSQALAELGVQLHVRGRRSRTGDGRAERTWGRAFGKEARRLQWRESRVKGRGSPKKARRMAALQSEIRAAGTRKQANTFGDAARDQAAETVGRAIATLCGVCRNHAPPFVSSQRTPSPDGDAGASLNVSLGAGSDGDHGGGSKGSAGACFCDAFDNSSAKDSIVALHRLQPLLVPRSAPPATSRSSLPSWPSAFGSLPPADSNSSPPRRGTGDATTTPRIAPTIGRTPLRSLAARSLEHAQSLQVPFRRCGSPTTHALNFSKVGICQDPHGGSKSYSVR